MNAVKWSTTTGEVRLHLVAPTWARDRAAEAWGRPGETWRDADAALRSIAQRRGALDVEEAEWLLRARAAQVHLHLGLPTFLAYLERVLGYGPRAAQERIRVAEALATQPGLRAELEAGRLA